MVPFKILNAVDFPIPLGPKMPMIDSFDGVGNRNNLNPFNEYLWIISVSSSSGRFITLTASPGQFFALIRQGGQASSRILHLSFSSTWIHSAPQEPAYFCKYSKAGLFGLHLSSNRTAIRIFSFQDCFRSQSCCISFP